MSPQINATSGMTPTYLDSLIQKPSTIFSTAATSCSRTRTPTAMVMKSARVRRTLTSNHHRTSSQNSDNPRQQKNKAFFVTMKGNGIAQTITRALALFQDTPDLNYTLASGGQRPLARGGRYLSFDEKGTLISQQIKCNHPRGGHVQSDAPPRPSKARSSTSRPIRITAQLSQSPCCVLTH